MTVEIEEGRNKFEDGQKEGRSSRRRLSLRTEYIIRTQKERRLRAEVEEERKKSEEK